MSGLQRTIVALNLVGLSVLGIAGSAHAESADLLETQRQPQSETDAVSTSASMLTLQGVQAADSLLVEVEGRSPDQSLVAAAPTATLTEIDELDGSTAAAASDPQVSPAQPLDQTAPTSRTFDVPLAPATTETGLLAQTTDGGLYDDESGVDDGSPEPTLNNPTIEDDTPDPLFEDDAEPLENDPALDEEAQTDPLDPDTSEFSPGRATRSGPSYIGLGGNIGLGDGDTALGEGSFAVFSKVGVTSNISLRPAVLFSDDPTILIPVTIDFIPLVTDATEQVSDELGVRVSPFVGAGAAISTGGDSGVDFLATGGVDIGITERFTGVISVSASLFNNPAVGLLLGIGYNF